VKWNSAEKWKCREESLKLNPEGSLIAKGQLALASILAPLRERERDVRTGERDFVEEARNTNHFLSFLDRPTTLIIPRHPLVADEKELKSRITTFISDQTF